MRRGVAGLILGISLVLASVAWAAFVTSHTVLDPDRSERLADQLLDNTTLRSALVTRLSDAMASTLPDEVPVPRQTLESAAGTALDDPRVESLVRDGIVKTHRNALNGVSEPIVLDAGALSEATRDALVGQRPELDTVLPAAPPLSIELPTGGLAWLGRLRDLALKVVLFAGLAALGGATLAMVIAKDRAAVLRRVSFWAFGAAAFWLIIGYGIPWIATRVGPTSTAVATAIIDVLFGAMIRPAVIMALVGAGLFALSMVWASLAQSRPARVLQPAGGSTGPTQPAVRTPVARGGQTSNVRHPVDPTNVMPRPAQTPTSQARPIRAQPQPQNPRAQPQSPVPPLQQRPPAQAQPPQHRPAPQPSTQGPTPARNPQPAGYTDTPSPYIGGSSQPPTTRTRWVEGIGYVEVDEGPDHAERSRNQD